MSRRSQAIHNYAAHVSRGKYKTYRRYRMTLVPGERQGIYLHDLDGKRFMNFHCNGGVHNFGHKSPDFADTLSDAVGQWDAGTPFVSSPLRHELARALTDSLPGAIARTLLCASGSEAVDAAIKMAMCHTGRSKIVSARGAYHGGSALAVAAGDESFKLPFPPHIPGFYQARFGDSDALENLVDDTTAAVILETIPATLGMVLPPEGYFQRVRELCDTRGAVMIIDEVQTGFGRTGTLWGIEQFRVEPDVVIVGKGLSGGLYPIAATCFVPELEHVFHGQPFMHYSEYGGGDAGCAVALKVLERASSQEHLDHVVAQARWFSERLAVLARTHRDAISEIRQLGLFMAIAYKDEVTCAMMVKILFDEGIYTVYAGNDRSVMQFLPPLNITRSEAEEAIEILGKALEKRKKGRYRVLAKAFKMAMSNGP